MKTFYAILALAVLLHPSSGSAAGTGSTPESLQTPEASASLNSISSWQTTTTKNQSNSATRSKPHRVGTRTANITALRAEAIQISMKYLPRLRPYASNYPRMVRAVRAYWHANTKNPSAARLTSTIMRHVQAKYRFFVRPKLRSGVSRGIKVLKRKLRKS